MKSYILILLSLFCITDVANAQLTVSSSGSVNIPNELRTNDIVSKRFAATYSMTDTVAGFQSVRISSNSVTNAVGMVSHVFGGYRSIALMGNSQNFSNYGYCIGALGTIGSSNGAGIYGSAYPDYGVDMGGRYAGYFYGNVKITGAVTTSASLSPSSSDYASRGYDVNPNSASPISEGLAKIRLNTFFYEPSDIVPSNDANILAQRQVMRDAVSDGTVDATDIREQQEPDITPTKIESQILNKQHFGLDANELEEVFPNLVYDNEDGTKSINYVEMVPILIQAINELSAKVKSLEGEERVKKIGTRTDTHADIISDGVTMPSLSQNKPNPFDDTTIIEVSIPDEVQKAFIYIYDLTGKKVQQVDITACGKQSVTLDASSLTDGMYLYSLIVDGKVVQTRRMIVEK